MTLTTLKGPASDLGRNHNLLDRAARWEKFHRLSLLLPSFVVILVIVLLPVAWLIWVSFFDGTGALTFDNYTRMVEHSSYLRTFKTTFQVAFTVTLACVLLGYPLAYMMAQLDRRLAAICMIFVVMPFWTPVLVRTYAWLVLLQHKGLVNTFLLDTGLIAEPLGLVNNFLGVTIGMVHIMLPFLILPLYASMTSIDRDLVRAAMNLGSGPVAAFRQVFLPLSLPGLTAGAVLVFILCLGFFVTPALMGGGKVNMWAMRIQSAVTLHANWGVASALGVVLLLVTTACLVGLGRVFGRRSIGAQVSSGVSKQNTALPIPHVQRLWLYVLGGCIMFFLMAPALIVIPMSFSDADFLEFPPPGWSLRWYREYFGSVEWRNATFVSLKAAALTVLLATPLGTAAAYALHVGGFRLKSKIELAMLVPLMIPSILLGIGIFFLFAWMGLNNTLTGLVLAHTALAIPFVFMTVSSGLKSFDMNQEMVARSLGAPQWKAFFLITVPQVRFSIISGALFAFITSFDEVIIALFITGGENSTLPRRMFNALRDEIDPTIAAISTSLLLLSSVLLLVSQLLGKQKSG